MSRLRWPDSTNSVSEKPGTIHIARRLAVYVEPIWATNTNPLPSAETNENHTFQVGLASRLRLGSRTYLLGSSYPERPAIAQGTTMRHSAWRCGTAVTSSN